MQGSNPLPAIATRALWAQCDPSHSKPPFKVVSAKAGLERKFSVKRFDLRSARFVVNEFFCSDRVPTVETSPGVGHPPLQRRTVKDCSGAKIHYLILSFRHPNLPFGRICQDAVQR